MELKKEFKEIFSQMKIFRKEILKIKVGELGFK